MRRIAWWLVSLGLLLSAPARAQEEKAWTPDEITKQFEEVDRAIKQIERRSRPVERRLGEVEDQVRQLRLKLETLELHVKAMEEILLALRKDVGALAERLDASGAPPKEVRPPTKRVVPAKPVPATIRSQKVTMAADAVTITGVVSNDAKEPLVFVVVEVEFLDKNGEVVQTASAYTEPRVIPAGSTANFTVKCPRDSRMDTHRFSLRSE